MKKPIISGLNPEIWQAWWFTTSNAFRLSNVSKNMAAHESILASALASDTIYADITGDSPFVKPNCSEDCSKFFSISVVIPVIRFQINFQLWV